MIADHKVDIVYNDFLSNLLKVFLKVLPVILGQYIIVMSLVLLTKARVAKVKQGIIINMLGPKNICTTLIFETIIKSIKLNIV